jgi:hypothetical protein
VRTTVLALVVLAGCVDEFSGSNVQFDFSPSMPSQAPAGAMPKATELPTNIHFTLYAFQEDPMVGRLFAVQDFEIHKIVELTSPCFIDVGAHVPHPGLHVTQYATVIGMDTGIPDISMPPPGATEQQKIDAATAVQREMNVAALAGDSGLKVVSGASPAAYDGVAADCNDTTKIPPPTCIDEASNKRRLDMCQAMWKDNPEYFEGTDRVLTAPLAGVTHGMVDGQNPINLSPVGGAQFFVDEALAGFDGFAVYWQFDDADLDGMPDYPAGFPDAQKTPVGQLLLFGRPTEPTRDVLHVHMASPSSALTAELAIFANLGTDSTHF